MTNNNKILDAYTEVLNEATSYDFDGQMSYKSHAFNKTVLSGIFNAMELDKIEEDIDKDLKMQRNIDFEDFLDFFDTLVNDTLKK